VGAAADTAFATVQVSHAADTAAVRSMVERAVADSVVPLDVALGGQAFTEQPSAGGATEAVGLLAALVILLLMFRSVWAAALPILTGAVGVGLSLLLVMLGSHLMDLSSSSITMAALIGLGVGIDYALFHRQPVPEAHAAIPVPFDGGLLGAVLVDEFLSDVPEFEVGVVGGSDQERE
jgi:putative drug exporter of the RND superfamily